jgi:hypothetical protein
VFRNSRIASRMPAENPGNIPTFFDDLRVRRTRAWTRWRQLGRGAPPRDKVTTEKSAR